ncbi:hypothetical protein [Rahnella sp. PD4]|uniref:hypothetical protein n=1 Tax=Rahnella sp. PD4 TaxID=3368611 RepID=UPI003B9DE9C5
MHHHPGKAGRKKGYCSRRDIPCWGHEIFVCCAFRTICGAQGIPYFIAGTTAREILLHHVYGRAIGRRTRDIDFAVFVQEWQLFDDLKQALTAAGANTIKGNAHRQVLEDIELDIIPFGGVAEANKIAGPPDREVVMAVDGFEEAFRHTVLITMQSGEEIPFCSVPGLALEQPLAFVDEVRATFARLR